MTSCKIAVPQPKALHATLRKITETLAQELAGPTQFAPDWTDLEWTIARAVAAMHGVSPLLSHTLRWRGPVGWTRFLEAQKAHTAKRHVRIDDVLRRIDQRARQAGIAVVALKGAALHAMGVYAAGDRPMADVDLLVRPTAAESAAELLQSLGFHEVRKSWKERVFIPVDDRPPDDLGEHADNSVKVELHERIVERLPWRITDASHLIFPAQPHPGLNAYPSKASLMIHLLLHAAGSMPIQALRLLQLHDLALLSSQMADSDWDEVLEQSSPGSRLWWAFPPLKLTYRYYPTKIPIRVLNALADECPHPLKKIAERATLYGVSYSYLWVDAFPGIAWSQSVRELIAYAANRVRPSAADVVLREHDAKSQAWANRAQWSKLSQSRRILQWITSRPTRPLTMHAVRAALAQAH
jgi:hypothetical protein